LRVDNVIAINTVCSFFGPLWMLHFKPLEDWWMVLAQIIVDLCCGCRFNSNF